MLSAVAAAGSKSGTLSSRRAKRSRRRMNGFAVLGVGAASFFLRDLCALCVPLSYRYGSAERRSDVSVMGLFRGFCLGGFESADQVVDVRAAGALA